MKKMSLKCKHMKTMVSKTNKKTKLLTTNFEVKVENRKDEGLITYSTDLQVFKLKVNSETDQEVWGVYISGFLQTKNLLWIYLMTGY